MWTHAAAVRAAALADGDGLGDDVGGRLVGGVDHLGAGVLVLAVVGEGNGDDLAGGPCGPSARRRDTSLVRAAADVAVDPLDLSASSVAPTPAAW